MAEVLSQKQIDMLLNSMKNGDVDEAEVPEKKENQNYRLYDFYSPKKFTKDKLRILKGIYDNYCRIATSQINSLFRVNSEVTVVSIEEQRYYEFSNALSDNDIFTLVNIELPEEGKYQPMLIHISQILMANMIDRMLGGIVYDTSVDSSYSYTDLEMPLYERIMKYLVTIISDSWGSYIKLKASIGRIEENPSLFREISVDETVVIIMLNVDMQEISGKITICVPGDLLFTIFRVIEKGKSTDDLYEHMQDGVKEIIFDRLKASLFHVDARLANAELSLRDICGLKVGDVIDLKRKKDSPIDLYVEGQPWFYGQLGVHEKHLAVKLGERQSGDKEPEEGPEASDPDGQTSGQNGPEATTKQEGMQRPEPEQDNAAAAS